jgi:hypothetical protein
MRQIHGSCHCGNIRFIFDWPDPGPPQAMPAAGPAAADSKDRIPGVRLGFHG